jgi:hypothetical protein
VKFWIALLSKTVRFRTFLPWYHIPDASGGRFPKISKFHISIIELHPSAQDQPQAKLPNLLKMAQLRQEDIRALEQTRQRLYQLSQSIGSLKADVLRTSPMPAWYVVISLLY